MKNIFITLLFSQILLFSDYIFAVDKDAIEKYQKLCKTDIDFFRKQLKINSSPYPNKRDDYFHKWFQEGYKNALQLIDKIEDVDDCYYVMKYYINGFNQSHIALRGYISLPPEQYPGILSIKRSDGHYIFYKHPALDYLKEVKVGDKVTHINNIEIEKFYEDYLEPFYAGDNSELTLTTASMYALIIDGNRFKPVAKNITVHNGKESINIELKYTELMGSALVAAKKMRQPEPNELFKIELVSNGIWIKIPSFFPNRQEQIYFTGMLSRLKKDLAQEDFIIFDLRNNRGGEIKWSTPIIRNLWGDEYIKSLGDKHSYNKNWTKKIRVSSDNFPNFRNRFDSNAIKSYLSLLKNNEDFFLKKWSIFRDTDNLYTNQNNDSVKATIYILTDHFCRSTCWTFVNELKQIPGVIHLGEQTSIQSIYSYAHKVRAPSEYFDFFFPTQIRIQPDYKVGTSLIPDKIYEGDIKDEAKVLDWVLSIVEKE